MLEDSMYMFSYYAIYVWYAGFMLTGYIQYTYGTWFTWSLLSYTYSCYMLIIRFYETHMIYKTPNTWYTGIIDGDWVSYFWFDMIDGNTIDTWYTWMKPFDMVVWDWASYS